MTKKFQRWVVGVGVIGLIWVTATFFLVPNFINVQDNHANLIVKVKHSLDEFNNLNYQNEELKLLLKEFTSKLKNMGHLSQDTGRLKKIESVEEKEFQNKLSQAKRILHQSNSIIKKSYEPSRDHEELRHFVERNLDETLFFVRSELSKLKSLLSEDSPLLDKIDSILDGTEDRIRVTQFDLRNLSDIDGLKAWRKKESKSLSDLIQHRLYKLQNPSDCSSAKKLVCNLNKGCGYGCQIHHAVYCFIVAYGTKRTLILRSKNWRYNRKGWDEVFKPMSNSCLSSGPKAQSWPGNAESPVIELPIVDALYNRPALLPLAIPADLSDRIIRISGNPAAWWVGQFLLFMLKPQKQTADMLENMKKALDFSSPIVGVHVRRTDKVGSEAAFHSLEEYMKHVEEYFRFRSLSDPSIQKKVYLASDDPTVIKTASEKFPDYTFLGDTAIARSASVGTRYTDESLRGIIADIHFLSLCDYVVCTFSSQVCRVAYEIMQTRDSEAYRNFRSLDDIYYYGGQHAHSQQARFKHEPKSSSEIALEPGDLLGIAGNHWDGYSKGINRRSKNTGLYPSYKVKEVIGIAPVPNFNDLDA